MIRPCVAVALLAFVMLHPGVASARFGDPCLHDSLTIQGTVVDPDGVPVWSGHVTWVGVVSHADCRGTHTEYAETNVDGEGRFRFRVPAGRASVSIQTADRFGRTTQAVLAESLLTRDLYVDYRLRAIKVKGIVLEPTNQPLLGGSVTYYPFAGGLTLIDMEGIPMVPIERGRFLAIVRTPGPHVFALRPLPAMSGICSLTLNTPVWADTTIQISLAGPPVTGRVSGPVNRPLARALVSARSGTVQCSAITDSAGVYRMELIPGTYDWVVDPGEPSIPPRSFGPDTVTARLIRNFDLSAAPADSTSEIRMAPVKR